MENELGASFVVGIGASTDSVDALQQFFAEAPKDSKLAYVVIQPPFAIAEDQQGSLIGDCQLPVRVIENGMTLEANTIYIMPVKHNVIFTNGKFSLTQEHQNQRFFPVDVFFESLARELGKRAIGVILSGSGADGSAGMMALARANGLTIAQTPKSSEFDSMSLNAIETQAVDCVLQPEKMMPTILSYVHDPDSFSQQNRADHSSLAFFHDQIYAHLLSIYKVDFSHYKTTTISRRISRRVTAHQLQSLQSYLDLIASNPTELDELYRDLLIGVTAFFRDEEAFKVLASEALVPAMKMADKEGRELRIWVAACSSGEEAYSLAILVKEIAEQIGLMPDVKIFATDISKEFLAKAGYGIYNEKQMKGVSAERRKKFFIEIGVDYKVVSDIRNMVVFAPHNILIDPPFTKMDLVCCRNFLIYVQPIIQEKITDLLRYATKTDGYLFLGPSESLGDLEKGMLVIDSTWKIFQKLVEIRSSRSRSFPIVSSQSYQQESQFNSGRSISNHKTLGLEQYAYDQLLARYIEHGILVDSGRHILHIFGDAASYLKYQRGQFDRNLLLNVYEDLRSPLNSCFYQAELEKSTIAHKPVELAGQKEKKLGIEVTPLVNAAGHVTHYVVVFSDSEKEDNSKKIKYVNIDKESSQIIHDLEDELQRTRESLQDTIEKVESTNEELQSTNEELLASNEELRSTNEELHSVNKELYVVNAEHQKKIDELISLNTDIDNLLRSTDIGTVFVDTNVNLRRFTPAAAEIFDFLSTDIGRPLKDFCLNSDYLKSIDAILKVLDTGETYSKELKTARGILYLVRIMPYLTQSGQCDGAILTFVNITEIDKAKQILKKNNFDLEKEVEKRTHELSVSEKKYSELYENAPDMYLSVQPSTSLVLQCNNTFVHKMGYQSKDEVIGRPVFSFYDPGSYQLAYNAFQRFPHDEAVECSDIKMIRKDRTTISVSLRVSCVRDKNGVALYCMSSLRDISMEKAYQLELKTHQQNQVVFLEQRALFETVLDSVTDGWWDWHVEKKELYMSSSFKRLLGYKDAEINNTPSSWKKIILKDDYRKVIDALNSHLKKDKPFYIPSRYYHKNGSIRWVICRGKSIKDKQGVVKRIVGAHTDITALKLAQKELDIIAHSDFLTGLPNRVAFISTLKKTVLLAAEKKENFCLLYIDLDDFKRINDSLGHSYGDRFLIEAAKQLKYACREQDYLARVGGDEFVIISEFYSDKSVPDLIAKRILANFSEPLLVENKNIYSSLSIGLAVYPVAGDSSELLLKNADAAMYRAKKNGKNKYEYYTKDLDSIIQRRLEIEESLLHAVDNQELTAAYQPIFDLKTKKVIGFEALMRWKSTALGAVSPAEFIPIAERCGQIVALSDWFIDRVFSEFGKLIENHAKNDELILTVNLSVLQLNHLNIVDRFALACQINNISPKHVIIEMTETALINNIERAEKTICYFRECGFCVAVDDFGIGYSSLTALREFSLTHLKIDQSFIQGLEANDNKAIVNTLLKLGKWMNLDVIAEGIENEDQLYYLRNVGCRFAQGYFLQKPVDSCDMSSYLQQLETNEWQFAVSETV